MRAHRTDGLSLTFALIFFAVLALWAADALGGGVLPSAGWILAGTLITVGVVGLIGTWRAGAAPKPDQEVGPREDLTSDSASSPFGDKG